MPRKHLIQMSGAPGSGKSTLARLLNKEFENGIVIDHDVIRSSLLVQENPCFEIAAKQAYDLQWALARDAIKQGVCRVIIDSTCNFPTVLHQETALAAEFGYTYWYIECRVMDIELLDQRLRAREPMLCQRSGVDRPPKAAEGRKEENGWELFERWFMYPCRPDDEKVIITVDSTNTPTRCCDRVMEQIGRRQRK